MYMRSRNKYHARKTEANGIIFDSRVESMFYSHIAARLKPGMKLLVHQSYEVIPKQVINGKTYRKAVYTPDFVTMLNGKIVDVYDVKGRPTIKPDAVLRMKLFMQQYKAPVTICRYNYRTKQFEEKQL